MDLKFLALVYCFLAGLGNPSPVRRSTVRPQPGLCSLQGRALPPCQRWHKIDRNGCCRPCKCHRGKGKKLNTQDPCKEKCKPCIAKETFNQHFGYFCKSCQTCGANEVVVQQCTVYSDTVCHAVDAFVTMSRKNSGKLGRTHPRNTPKYTTNMSAIPTSTTYVFRSEAFGTMSTQDDTEFSVKEKPYADDNSPDELPKLPLIITLVVISVGIYVFIAVFIAYKRTTKKCIFKARSKAPACYKSTSDGLSDDQDIPKTHSHRLSKVDPPPPHEEIKPSDFDKCNPASPKDAHPSVSEVCDAPPNILTEEKHRRAFSDLTQYQTNPELLHVCEVASLDSALSNLHGSNSSDCQMLSKTNRGSCTNLSRQCDLHQESPNKPGIHTVERLDVAQCEKIPKILKDELRKFKFIDCMEIWNNRLRVHVCLSMCEGKTNEEIEEMVKSLVETHGNIDKTDCDVVIAESPVKLTFYNYLPSAGAKLMLKGKPNKYMTIGAYATTGNGGVVYLLSAGHGVNKEKKEFIVHSTNGGNIECTGRYSFALGDSSNFPSVDIAALEASGLKLNDDCTTNYVKFRDLCFMQVFKADVKQLSEQDMYKIGATTGRTESVIIGRDYTKLDLGIENLVLLDPRYKDIDFCRPGDSGAIIRRKADDLAVLMLIGNLTFSSGEMATTAFKLCDGLEALKEVSESEWKLLVHTDVEIK